MTASSKPQAPDGDRLGLLIGRFQPFHRGHELLCREALAECQRLLIILGSGGCARSLRNPWTAAEREQLIRDSLPDVAAERLLFAAVPDVFYNEGVWLAAVEQAVTPVQQGARVRLYGHTKDASSYYLALFPQWDYRELPNHQDLSATPLREALLAAGVSGIETVLRQWREQLPAAGDGPLRALLQTPGYAELHAEFRHIRSSREAWAGSPYTPIFVTADALVEAGDQLLLVRRGQRPGRGLWALPGGFIEPEERLEAAARRELAEETGLKLSEHAYQWQAAHVYDAPERSDRGRVITHLQHYRLQGPPPPLRAADDAAEVRWWRFDELRRDALFDDHYCILQHALKRYP